MWSCVIKITSEERGSSFFFSEFKYNLGNGDNFPAYFHRYETIFFRKDARNGLIKKK